MPLNNNFVRANNIIGLYANISPLVVMITYCVFCYNPQNIKSNKIFDFISSQLFGMYLIHQFFLNIFLKFLKFTPDRYPLILVVMVITITTVIFSLLFSVVIRKIKFVNKCVL